MKKFAYIKWAKTEKEIYQQNQWLKFLPSFLRENYIINYCPLKMKEQSIMDLEGYEVTLPFTVEQANKKSDKVVQKIINKAMEILKSNKVKIICPPKGHIHKIDYSIYESKGQYVIPLFIFNAVKELAKKLDKPLKYIEITIIDGENLKTDLVLDIIYPNVNYLNLITDKLENFKEKSIDIYEDVGLNLQLISHNKKTTLENSDIVIDCTDSNHNNFYYCRKNSIYIYIGSNKDMVKDILLKRTDLIVIDNFSLLFKNESYTTEFCEMLWYISKPWFNNIISNDYDLILLKKIIKEINKDGWRVGEIYQYGKVIVINKMNYIDKIF